MIDFQLLVCLECEYPDIAIESVAFSTVNLFVSFGYITGEIHIYSLISELDEYFNALKKLEVKCQELENKKKESNLPSLSFKAKCNCLEEFESNIQKEKSASLSLFGKIVKLKSYFFDKQKKPPFSNLIFHSGGKHFVSFFEKRNEITFITDRLCQKFKFSSVEGGRGWCQSTIEFNKSTSFKSKGSSNSLDDVVNDYGYINDEDNSDKN